MLIDRRQILHYLLSGSLSLPLWLKSTENAHASNKPQALLLTCIDYRFIDIEQNFLKQQNLTGKYDWLSLAGASLALTNFPSNADTQAFWEQLDLSVQLHQIERIIIIDHQDCGAYKTKFSAQLSQDSVKELTTHRQYLQSAAKVIQDTYPNLKVELYFAKLDGTVDNLSFV